MRILSVIFLIVLLAGCMVCAGGTTDATFVWDAVAESYNFPTVASATLTGSFESEYLGADFETDFAGVLRAVATALGTATPGYSGEIGLREGVENWPDE